MKTLSTSRAFARFKELDRKLSDYDPESELMVLCREAVSGQPQPVSEDLFTVLQRAEEVSRQTSGAFDVTIGPLTDLWRKARRRHQLPPDGQRLSALSHVGWEDVVLGEDAPTVDLTQPGMQLDLGGIAKGYAADEALKVMAEAGVPIALVDAGGDLVAGDPPPGEKFWRVGVAPLDAPRGTPERFLRLTNAAAATSGDASQHIEVEGVRYSHIVDPQTGIGVTTPSSVTVIADDAMTADALASALSVLGPKRGIALADEMPGIEAYILTRNDAGDVLTYESQGIGRYLVEAAR